MAVHEIHERLDGVVEEYHEFAPGELDDAVRRINKVLPDGLAFGDLPGELRTLDPDDLIEFFQVAR